LGVLFGYLKMHGTTNPKLYIAASYWTIIDTFLYLYTTVHDKNALKHYTAKQSYGIQKWLGQPFRS
jgi:hypothetical protein